MTNKHHSIILSLTVVVRTFPAGNSTVAQYPSRAYFQPDRVIMEKRMEKEEMKGLSDEELQQRIGSLLEAMRKERPEELERLKGIIRKSVPFFTRSAFSAYLLMLAAEGRKAPEKKGERRSRPDRPEKPRTASEPRQAQEKAKAEPKPERVIPEGAKTIYINVGKMKHLYAKDLSKLLQGVLGITRDDIYAIRIHDKYSFVTMSEENCQKAIEKVSGMDINGRTASVSFAEKKGGAKEAEKQD